MAYEYQLKVRVEVSSVRSGSSLRRRIFVQAALALSLIFIGAASISAQDLGALAREERARKQAEPPHEVHIYTNDDLARPKILIPEDDAKIRNEVGTPEPAADKSPPAEAAKSDSMQVRLGDIAKISTGRGAPERVKVEASPVGAVQPDPLPVPLGDIARQYREQKMARQQHVRVEARVSSPSHTYTNEDLTRPTILTPEDHEVFEAAQKKQSPATEQKTPEIEAMEQGHFNPSLGNIARLYRRQFSIPEVMQPDRFPLLLGVTAFAAPAIARSVIRPPPRVRRVSRKFRLRRTAQRLIRPENFADQTITVKPGDTLWRLARQHLGQGRRWREFQKSNSWIRDPHYLRVGSQIRI